MRILFVTANSRKAYLDIEREHRSLLEAVEQGRHTLKIMPAAEIGDLKTALAPAENKKPFDVLHFAGHATEAEGIVLRGPGQSRAELSGEALGDMLRGSDVKLVVLNACNSRPHAEAIGKVVPAAIGTTAEVADWAAREFTEKFYAAVNTGETVGAAFAAATAEDSSNMPYMHAGELFADVKLPQADESTESQVDGNAAFYRHYYADYIDQQLAIEDESMRLNNIVFWVLLGAGLLLTGWLLSREPAAANGLEALIASKREALKIDDPWGFVKAVDEAAPIALTLLQKRFGFYVSKRKQGLQELKRLVENWGRLPDEQRERVLDVLHNSLKESLASEE